MILGQTYLFIHIPKTGGTSITNALIEQHNSKPAGHGDAHSIPRGQHEFLGKVRFAFVREPIDFYRSWYAYRKTFGGRGWGFDSYMGKDFPSFVKACAGERLLTKMYKRFDPFVDVFGRFERLEADLNAIMLIAKQEPVKLPILNRGEPEHANMDLITDDLIAFVKSKEQFAFDLWGKTENGIFKRKVQ